MMRGQKIGLRARHESDIAILEEELYNDVREHVRADTRPWRPLPPGSSHSPYVVESQPNDKAAAFSVVRLVDDALAGEAVLWGIDPHNRTAHIGLSLLPAFRGQGLGIDVVRTMCEYGFAVLGLQRLQIETLSDNDAMIATALRAGFVREGTLRRSAWVYGEFCDDALFGLLETEWRSSQP